MSQREARGALAMPGVGKSPAKATPRLLAGTDRKRSRLSRTGQDLWEETSWSNQRWSRAAPSPRGARARSLARGQVRKPGPEEVAGRGRHGRGCDVPSDGRASLMVTALPKRGDIGQLPLQGSMLGWLGKSEPVLTRAWLRELAQLTSLKETEARRSDMFPKVPEQQSATGPARFGVLSSLPQLPLHLRTWLGLGSALQSRAGLCAPCGPRAS